MKNVNTLAEDILDPKNSAPIKKNIVLSMRILGTSIPKIRLQLTRQIAASVKATYRSRYLFAADLALVVVAMLVASFFRFGFVLFADASVHSALAQTIPAFVLVCAFIFPACGLYSRNWTYTSLPELFLVARTVVTSALIFIALMFLYTRLHLIPRSIVASEIFLLTPMMLALRLRARIQELPIWQRTLSKLVSGTDAHHVPVLLVGVCSTTDLYLRALQRDPSVCYEPVGILDNSMEQQGLSLRTVPVVGQLSELERVIAELDARGKRPRHIIFTQPVRLFDSKDVQQLIGIAERCGITVSRLSSVTELHNACSENRFELKAIQLTDLLERPQAALDRAAITQLIVGRRVLITGAGGSIGSELTRQIAALSPSELILIENSELNLYTIDMEMREAFTGVELATYMCDIRDRAHVMEIFERHSPHLVFHAAALKHVPLVELNPCEGVMTNVIGTMNIAEASRHVKARAMVQISTDKAVNTTNVMGASKRLAELYCQALDIEGHRSQEMPRYLTVCFGNVLGSSGSLIPLFKKQIERGGPVTVTDPNMSRFFMTIREAVELTMQASAVGLQQGLGQGEIFVLDMGEPIKVIDIARRMIKLAGFEPNVDIKIEIIGRRPGEKLFEELFDQTERRLDMRIPGIFRAVPIPVELGVLRRAFERIHSAAVRHDEDAMFEAIKALLPNYHRERRSPSNMTAIPRTIMMEVDRGAGEAIRIAS